MTVTAKTRKKKQPKTNAKKRRFKMRQCLCGCLESFYPTREWQRFVNATHAAKDRQKRLRDRYRELKEIHAEELGVGNRRRKVVQPRQLCNVTDYTQKEKGSMVALPPKDELPRNRSPESNGDGQPKMLSKRLRKLKHVHPRSLEQFQN